MLKKEKKKKKGKKKDTLQPSWADGGSPWANTPGEAPELRGDLQCTACLPG